MLNVPPEIGMHLHQTLMQEIQQAADHDKSYAFQHFVMLSGFYQELKKAAPKKAQRADGADVYFREEEGMYARAASLSVTFPIMHNQRTSRWSFAGAYTFPLLSFVN